MKKFTLILVIIAFLTIPCLLIAAGTATQTYQDIYSAEGMSNMSTLTFAWTSDSSESATSATGTTITNQIAGKYVVAVVTDPDGTSAPTDNYDVVITDANSVDIMGGTLANRDTANSEQATPYIGASYGSRPLGGAITLTVTSAGSGNSGSVILYLSRQK